MKPIIVRNFILLFLFGCNNGDLIKYITDRECTDLDSMIDYCYAWLNKFEDKYGTCLEIKIYKSEEKYNLVYDKVID